MKPSVTESQLDSVLAAAIRDDDRVVKLLLKAVGLLASYTTVALERQVRHLGVHGTADLVARFHGPGRLEAMLLIENKIDAGFTPDQPDRYRSCKAAHLASGTAPQVATLLVAPRVYLLGSRLKSSFDGVLAYEDIIPLLSGPARGAMELAVLRAESPYEPDPVAEVMDFFDGYSLIAAAVAPGLTLKRNPNSGGARPKDSRTMYFEVRTSGVRPYPFLVSEGKPAALRFSHQCWDSSAASPSVKLMLGGWSGQAALATRVLGASARADGLYFRAAGRSLALAADTPRLDNFASAVGQRRQIEDALRKAMAIRDWWNRSEQSLREFAALTQR